MSQTRAVEDILRKLGEALPEGLGQLHEDARKNLRSVLAAALARADLVTREEFDVQSAVLARTRDKLTALEETVARLEQALLAKNTPAGGT